MSAAADGPSITMPVLGRHCQAIMESRHIDVIEMDAASHNGVDDVRQINDAIRYAPVSARYKVYILDEVHMLSTQAFNALLKTLEEPPPHAKFVFATTEIRKVPITILSRCQRFDLRRVEASMLVRHLEGIAGKEAIEVAPEALALIARAAEGSVRDALSLLDQAIAHAAGAVRSEHVRQMLGLADRARIIDLFEALMRGDMAAALAELRAQYDIGAEPAVVLGDLAELTHFVTRVKVVPSLADDPALIEVERTRGRALAEKLSMRVLARTWQMLLKGLTEVSEAARPLAVAEMVLVRIAYAADLPTPDEVIRTLDGGNVTSSGSAAAPRADTPAARPTPAGASRASAAQFSAAVAAAPVAPAPAAAGPAAQPVARERAPTRGQGGGESAEVGGAAARALSPVPAPAPPAHPDVASAAAAPSAGSAAAAPQPGAAPRIVATLDELIALAAEKRDLGIKLALERDLRLVRCEEGRLEIRLEPSAAKTLVNDLARKLSQWTSRRWMVIVSTEHGAPTVKAQHDARDAALKLGVRADPLVQAVLARFPGAEIVEVRKPERLAAPAGGAAAPPADTEQDTDLIGAAEIAEAGEGAEPASDEDGSAFGAHGPQDI